MLRADVRDAVRGFGRNPGFVGAAILSIALGVGANTAIFSVASALLLHPLPYSQPDRLVILWNRSPGLGITQDWFSTGQYFDIKAACSSCDQVAIAYGSNLNLTADGGEPQRIGTVRVSSNLLTMFGAQPELGRLFVPAEDSSSPSSVAVLSHDTWMRRYGGDTHVIDRSIDLNGLPYRIVGVLPASFTLTREVLPTVGLAANADIVIPLPMGPKAAETRNREDYNVLATLKPGATIQEAQGEMDSLTRRLRQEHPALYPPNGGLTFSVVALQEQVVGAARRPLAVLIAAVGFVLLIACANVASLLLSRGVAREKEVAVRAALGANRARIVRQLLTESLLLGVAGGAAGLAAAFWGLRAMQTLGASSVPRLGEIGIDGRVLAFTLLLSLASALIFGLAPAVRASRVNLQAPLTSGTSGTGGLACWGPRQRSRTVLVAIELMLSVMLLAGAGLLIRSYLRAERVPPGFNPHNLLTLELNLSGRKYTDTQKVVDEYRDLLGRLGRLPGVTAVGAAAPLPLSNMMAWGPITVEGRPLRPGEGFINVDQRVTAGDYFRAMDIRLLQGRLFTDADTRTSPRVAIVDSHMARELWPNEDPIGKRIRTGGADADPAAPWITVVGVAGDIKQDALERDARMALYLAHAQTPTRGLIFVVRTPGDPAGLTAAVRREIHDLNPNLPVYNMRSMDSRVAESLARRRFSMLLLTVFAALAAGLAALGIYGVIVYSVTQGTREVGIRMALGATPRGIGLLVVRHGAVIAAVGLLAGIAGALLVTRLMRSLLFGVDATDPATFTLVSILAVVTALVASYIPARRAARLDPLQSLRQP